MRTKKASDVQLLGHTLERAFPGLDLDCVMLTDPKFWFSTGVEHRLKELVVASDVLEFVHSSDTEGGFIWVVSAEKKL